MSLSSHPFTKNIIAEKPIEEKAKKLTIRIDSPLKNLTSAGNIRKNINTTTTKYKIGASNAVSLI